VRSNPNWKHRRRLIYSTVGLAFAMIVFGAFVWRDGMVASELVRSGTALVTVILTSYVFGAVLDDHWQKDDGDDG
jgi:polyferredoxin